VRLASLVAHVDVSVGCVFVARSAVVVPPRPVSFGQQSFDLPEPFLGGGGDAVAEGAVGATLPHTSGAAQVSGIAQYADDLRPPHGCLEAAVVVSSQPYARIVSIDTAAALAIPGVIAVVTAKDVPGVWHAWRVVAVCWCGDGVIH
jgi:hypothetical protein